MNSKDKLEVVLEDEDDDASAAIVPKHTTDDDEEEEAEEEDALDEDNNDVEEVDDTVSVVKELEDFSASRRGRKPSVESNFRRMSTLSAGNGGFASHPIRRGRRRAVTTQDHKMCALVQTRLKLGDIM